jgi:hypothetical protein
MINPKSKQLQFMASAVGCGAAGKKRNVKARIRKPRAIPLTKRPNLPRLKREGRSGSPRIRLSIMQQIATIYDETRPSTPKDVITLNAIEDPIITRDRSVVNRSVTKIALTGTSIPGRT